MQNETQHKAIAGAFAALLASVIPVLMAYFTGSDIDPMAFETFSQAASSLGSLIVAALVGWVTVYFAPRNQKKDSET